MISYFHLETLLLGDMLVLQTILKSWNERREESFPAPTQAYYCARVMEFLYISFHPYQTNLISFSGSQGTSTSTQHPLPGERSPSPASPISRWEKWYTIWCKKLWPTSASHKPSGWPRRAVKWHERPTLLGRKSSGIFFCKPQFSIFWWNEANEASRPTTWISIDQQTNRPNRPNAQRQPESLRLMDLMSKSDDTYTPKCKVPKSKKSAAWVDLNLINITMWQWNAKTCQEYNLDSSCISAWKPSKKVRFAHQQKAVNWRMGFRPHKFKIKLRLTTSALFLCNEPAHGPNHPVFLQDMVDTNCIKLPHLWSWYATLLEHYPSKNCAKCRPRRFLQGYFVPSPLCLTKKEPRSEFEHIYGAGSRADHLEHP